jgi:cysteine desulfurase
LEKRLPGNINVSLPGVEGETLLICLDQKGICAASGSACSTGSLEPSHVLTAIGREPLEAKGSLRLTLSYQNTIEEVDRVVEELAALTKDLRSRSKLYEEYLSKHR